VRNEKRVSSFLSIIARRIYTPPYGFVSLSLSLSLSARRAQGVYAEFALQNNTVAMRLPSLILLPKESWRNAHCSIKVTTPSDQHTHYCARMGEHRMANCDSAKHI
jgi:hypothetical protein